MLCKIIGHKWKFFDLETCSCERCYKMIPHELDGCTCQKCGGYNHAWDLCVCQKCGCDSSYKYLSVHKLTHSPYGANSYNGLGDIFGKRVEQIIYPSNKPENNKKLYRLRELWPDYNFPECAAKLRVIIYDGIDLPKSTRKSIANRHLDLKPQYLIPCPKCKRIFHKSSIKISEFLSTDRRRTGMGFDVLKVSLQCKNEHTLLEFEILHN